MKKQTAKFKKTKKMLLSLLLSVFIIIGLISNSGMETYAGGSGSGGNSDGPWTVSFNANGGSGNMETVEVTNPYESYDIPDCTFTAPAGKEFVCWLEPYFGDLTSSSSIRLQQTETVLTAQWRSKTKQHKLTINGVSQDVYEGDYVEIPYVRKDDVPAGKYFTEYSITPAAQEKFKNYRNYYTDWFIMPDSDVTITYVCEDQHDITFDRTHKYNMDKEFPSYISNALSAAADQGIINYDGGSTTTYDLNKDGKDDIYYNFYDREVKPGKDAPDKYKISGMKNTYYKSVEFIFRDNVARNINITGGKTFVDGKEASSAVGGTTVSIVPDEVPNKYVVGWKSDVVGIGPFFGGSRGARPSFGMPCSDVSLTPVYTEPYIVDLSAGVQYIDEDIFMEEFRNVYSGLSSVSSNKPYNFDLDGDGNEDVQLTWYYGSGASYVAAVALGTRNIIGSGKLNQKYPYKYYPIIFNFSSDPIEYDVTFEANGGSGEMKLTGDYSETIILPENEFTPPEGTGFSGWQVFVGTEEPVYLYPGDSVNITSITTIRPIWKKIPPIQYKVSFETNGGSEVAEQIVDAGNSAVKPENPVKDGYTFAGWYKDIDLKTEYDFGSTVDTDIKIYAKWNIKESRNNGSGNETGGNGNSGNGNSGNGNSGNGNGNKENDNENIPVIEGTEHGNVETGLWVEKPDGTYPVSQWAIVNGKKYYFDKRGYAASNEYADGKWFNADGTLDESFSMEWKSNENGWWIEDKSGWYPVSRWLKIDGYYYYFNEKGYMAYSEYRDGCWLGADGAWVEEYSGGHWSQDANGWWYEDSAGWYPVSQYLWIDGTRYWFNANGYWE